MKKKLADALRALARRLDAPAPLVVHIDPVTTSTANQVTSQINWTFRSGR